MLVIQFLLSHLHGAAEPSLTAIVIGATMSTAVRGVPIALAATMAIFGAPERATRARLVLGDLLGHRGRGGRQ